MSKLFTVKVTHGDIPEIPGLRYLPEYICEDEELRLVRAIDRLPWDMQWKRRRQPYGASYGKVTSTPPIPTWGEQLAERMFLEGVTPRRFDQMLVNEYEPGQGISPHRDYAPFGGTVVSLSLLSSCVMELRRIQDGRKEQLLLERRSLLVLSGQSRYDWEHGIAPRKKDVWQGVTINRSRRISVTFRFVLTPRGLKPAG